MKSAFCCKLVLFLFRQVVVRRGISLLFMQCINRSGGRSISSKSIRKAFACAFSLS